MSSVSTQAGSAARADRRSERAGIRARAGVHRPAVLRRGLGLAWVAALLGLGWTGWLDRDVPIDTWAFGNACLGVALGATGLLLTRRVPRNAIGWFFLAGGLGQAWCGATRGWTVHLAVADPARLDVARWTGLTSGIAQTVGLFTLPLVLLHFPDGRLRSRGWRPALWFVLGVFALTVGLSTLAPGSFTPELPQVSNPLGLDWLPAGPLWSIAGALPVLAVVVSAVGLLLRWRGAVPDERRALRWVTLAGLVLAAEVCLEMTPISDGSMVFTYLGPAALALFVGAIAAAVLRHHLWDLDVLVNVSLVYTLLMVVVAVVFVAAVEGSARLLDHAALVWPAVVAGGVLLVAVVPLRRAVRLLVDRLLYGTPRDPRRELARLTTGVSGPGTAHAGLDRVASAVASTFPQLDHVTIRTARGAVTVGPPPRTQVVALPLRFHGSTVGELEIAGPPGAPVRGHVRALLGEVSTDLAPVVHAIEVTAAVEEARRALATTREEERRRLRRDIHDGVGPALAAVALQIEGAASLIDAHPGLARQTLLRLAPEVRSVLDDVRRLVYDLRPPELDAIGLAGAVREQALRFCGAGVVPVEVDGPDDLGELPAAAEVAAYRIVGEALSNVARHAQARSVRVDLRVEAGRLVVCVDDDGQAWPAAGPTGSARCR